MKHVDLYGRVRHAVLVDGMSRREAARIFGINRRTVEKMLMFSIPPGYRRDIEIRRPKLDGFIGIIDQILAADKLVPKKQRHTSKRVFERLRDEHGFTGGITTVKDYIFAAKQRQRERTVCSFRHYWHFQCVSKCGGSICNLSSMVEVKRNFLLAIIYK